MTRLKTQLHFEWVPSELNITDPISRRECQLASTHGWQWIPPTLDKFYEILIRCSTDLHYAARQGAVDCMHLHSGLQPNDLVQNGIDGPDMAEKWPSLDLSWSGGWSAP